MQLDIIVQKTWWMLEYQQTEYLELPVTCLSVIVVDVPWCIGQALVALLHPEDTEQDSSHCKEHTEQEPCTHYNKGKDMGNSHHIHLVQHSEEVYIAEAVQDVVVLSQQDGFGKQVQILDYYYYFSF